MEEWRIIQNCTVYHLKGIYVSLLLTLSHSYHICLCPYLFILLPSSYLYANSSLYQILSMIYEFIFCLCPISISGCWLLPAWGIYRITTINNWLYILQTIGDIFNKGLSSLPWQSNGHYPKCGMRMANPTVLFLEFIRYKCSLWHLMGHTFIIITPFHVTDYTKHDGIYLAQGNICLSLSVWSWKNCMYLFSLFFSGLVCNLIYIFIATFAMHG